MKKSLVCLFLIVTGVGLGILAERKKGNLVNAQFIHDHLHFRKELSDSERKGVLKSDQVMVFLAFGQSNAGNYGEGPYQVRNAVYNYYKGEIYPAEEPLLGPDGTDTSVWTRLADQLIDSGIYKQVIIVPCAIGSTSVQCWSEGDCRKKLLETLQYLKKDGIRLTHAFWDQGETDNVEHTTKEHYKAGLRKVIDLIHKDQGNIPFFASISSYFPYVNDRTFGVSKEITAAQTELISEMKGVKFGPNTDSLSLAYYRVNMVHFSEKGLDQLAKDWFKKIRENKE